MKFHSAEHRQALALASLADGMGHVTNARDGLFTAYKALARAGKITMQANENRAGDWFVKMKGNRR